MPADTLGPQAILNIRNETRWVPWGGAPRRQRSPRRTHFGAEIADDMAARHGNV